MPQPTRRFPSRLAIPCLLVALALLVPPRADARNPDVSEWMTNLSSGSLPDDNNDTHIAPEIAVVGDTVHALWLTILEDGSYRRQIWYRRSLDKGVTWQPRVQIAETAQNDLDVSEAVKRLHVIGQTVHIAFTGYTSPEGAWTGTVFYRRSVDNGASFSDVVNLLQTKYIALTHGYITGENDNIDIVVRLRSESGFKRDSGELLHSADNGATFIHTQVFEYAHDDPAYAGAAVYDIQSAGSNIYVMYGTGNGRGCSYAGDSRMYLAHSANSGLTFNQSLLSIPQADGCYKTSIGQDGHYVTKLAAADATVAAVWTGNNTDGVQTVFYRRSDNGGTDLEPPVQLSAPSTTAIQAGQETIKRDGPYVYAMWTTTGGQLSYRTSPDGGQSFQPVVEASSAGWFPIISLDPAMTEGSRNSLFWQGTFRRDAGSGAALTAKGYLFPLFRTSWPQREQALQADDGALHYAMGALFYSQALCGGNCRQDIFYRRHSFTPPAPTNQRNLRVISEFAPFEGRFDNMHVPASADLAPAGAFTVELWVKPSPGGTNTGYTNDYRPVAFMPSGLGFAYALGTIIAHEGGSPVSDRIITAEITTTQGNYHVNDQYADTGYVPYETWSHLAMTYDPAAGGNNLRLYLNGALVAAIAASGTVVTDGNPFQAGHYGIWDIDDVRVWNKALSQTEIGTSMRSHLTTAAGLVANYNFNDTTKDVTNRGNNGILMFMEQFVPDSRPAPSTAGQMMMLLFGN